MTFENNLDEERGKMFQGYSIRGEVQGVKGCTSLGPSLPIIQAIRRASRGRGMVSGIYACEYCEWVTPDGKAAGVILAAQALV
jgi:hypothetical protein